MHPPAARVDPDIELSGPWTHRYVSANGARFHLCESIPAGSTTPPLVLLLHGFPEFWWAWRHQLPVLASAGYHAVAMDLRGYGASDKTPRGYDPLTLASDVAGVIRSLGARRVILVGHGWGGYVGWVVSAQSPECVRALCAVSAPHPLALTRSPASWSTRKAVAHLLAMQVPWAPERRIGHGTYISQHLAAWSAADSGFPAPEEAARYRAALARWPSPHCALEYHRWLVRSRFRADGRTFARAMRRQVDIPVVHIGGVEDPVEPAAAVTASARYVTGGIVHHAMAGAGHFPHEERPADFNRLLLAWLSQRTVSGPDTTR